MLLPAVHVPRLVVPAQHEDLVLVECLERDQVRDHLEAVQAAVHVVSEEEELARAEVHPEPPQVVAEEVQVLELGSFVVVVVVGCWNDKRCELELFHRGRKKER